MRIKLLNACSDLQNISMYKLAQQLDLPNQMIYAWNSGKSFPSFTNILKITKILDCSIDDLVNNYMELN